MAHVTFAWHRIEAGVTVHVPKGTPRSCVLYLHGGGLLYGQRDDLPSAFIGQFLSRGHALACADYPLAPETPLREIHGFVDELWRWCVEELASKLGTDRVFLFGRSAGAYLALTQSGRLCERNGTPRPVGVIDFYGYDNMGDPSLAAPSKHYRQLPLLSRSKAEALVEKVHVTSGSPSKRYALYVYARQQGVWNDLLSTDGAEGASYAITDAQAASMPPVFYAASTEDRDIPYAISKRLARRLQATMATVYGLEHDFDRDWANPAAINVYGKLFTWMDAVLPSRPCRI